MMRHGEFVALAASMVCLTALSIDAMLPALPAIADDLRVAGNDVQLVVSMLLLGLGIGQFAYGPVSDSFGRKPAICAGFAIFIAGCALSMAAQDFHTMLAGRVLQGIGAAGPRTVTIALVRDQFEGRQMARVMSFVMAVFVLVPALAPALGQGILALAGWREIFTTLLALAAAAAVWFVIRQPETLPAERRIPFSARRITAALREIVTTPVAIGYTLAAGFVFSAFVGYLSTAQQVFQDTYGVGALFPACFGILALAIGAASITNARLVLRYGMRRLSARALVGLFSVSVSFWAATALCSGIPPLWLFMASFIVAFFCIGMLFGNLNALAMEPLGHIAGIGAGVIGTLSTCIAAPVGIMIGRGYDGTLHALAAGFTVFSLAALLTARQVERHRGRE